MYAEIATAYEVEFLNADESVRTLVTPAYGQFQHLAPGEILTTRQQESWALGLFVAEHVSHPGRLT